MQEMYIINGRPMLSGKLSAAILNNKLAEPLRPVYSGAEGSDDRIITVTGRPQGEAEPLSITLRVRDAKTNNEQWKKNPDQMLMYAASRIWGRRYTPAILLGITFDDEEIIGRTVPPITIPNAMTPIAAPPQQHVASRKHDPATAPREPIAASQAQHPELVDPETGEIITDPVELPCKPGEEWRPWCQRVLAGIRSSPDIDTIDRWLALNARDLGVLFAEKPALHANFMHAVQQQKLEHMGEST
jgi:hypothetical protein